MATMQDLNALYAQRTPLLQQWQSAAPGTPQYQQVQSQLNALNSQINTMHQGLLNGGIPSNGGPGVTQTQQIPGMENGGFGSPTTIGALAGGLGGMADPNNGATGGGTMPSMPGAPGMPDTGAGSIPGTQPNYPLDIGSYLNPMMKYAMTQGINTINNSAAAQGSLDSGDTLKSLMQFGMGIGANNFNNAAGIAAGQQSFGYNVDNNDRNFAYNSQVGDRDFNYNRDMGMAGLGLNAAGQESGNAQTLARILAANGLSAGQAAAGGTIGGGNAMSNAISQIIASLYGPGTGQ